MSALPEQVRNFAWVNPLVLPIELLRAMALAAPWPETTAILAYAAMGLAAAVAGALWFRIASKGFGDVL